MMLKNLMHKLFGHEPTFEEDVERTRAKLREMDEARSALDQVREDLATIDRRREPREGTL